MESVKNVFETDPKNIAKHWRSEFPSTLILPRMHHFLSSEFTFWMILASTTASRNYFLVMQCYWLRCGEIWNGLTCLEDQGTSNWFRRAHYWSGWRICSLNHNTLTFDYRILSEIYSFKYWLFISVETSTNTSVAGNTKSFFFLSWCSISTMLWLPISGYRYLLCDNASSLYGYKNNQKSAH